MKMLLGALGGGLVGWLLWRLFDAFSPRARNTLPDFEAPILTPEAIRTGRKEALFASGVAVLFIGYVVAAVFAIGLWVYGAGSLFMQQRLIESAVALVLPPIGMGYGLFRLIGWW
jgi:hypothetical protein